MKVYRAMGRREWHSYLAGTLEERAPEAPYTFLEEFYDEKVIEFFQPNGYGILEEKVPVLELYSVLVEFETEGEDRSYHLSHGVYDYWNDEGEEQRVFMRELYVPEYKNFMALRVANIWEWNEKIIHPKYNNTPWEKAEWNFQIPWREVRSERK